MAAGDKWRRVGVASLWLAAPFNLLAATVIAFPGSALGQLLGLPAAVSPVYTALLALFVALFGLVYGWLATRPSIDRPLLALGAIGKFGAFVVVLSLWSAGVAPGVLLSIALGDLAFAALWFGWLLSTAE